MRLRRPPAFLLKSRGRAQADELWALSKVYGKPPHRVLGLDELTEIDALRFNASVYRASRLYRMDALREFERRASSGAMGIDTIIRLLSAVVVEG